jgi:hypothetical protein
MKKEFYLNQMPAIFNKIQRDLNHFLNNRENLNDRYGGSLNTFTGASLHQIFK